MKLMLTIDLPFLFESFSRSQKILPFLLRLRILEPFVDFLFEVFGFLVLKGIRSLFALRELVHKLPQLG